MGLPIDVKTIEFSDPKELERPGGQYALWNLKGASSEITILATAQSSWVVDGEVRHLLTILYREKR